LPVLSYAEITPPIARPIRCVRNPAFSGFFLMTLALDVFLWLLGAALLIAALRRMRAIATLPALKDIPPNEPDELPPSVSIIAAARNEQHCLAQTIPSWLAQRNVDLEVIVVDDRSTDRTGEILRDFSQREPRLKPIRVDALPNGWLGKCHALRRGAQQARGTWLLFTDADVRLAPDALGRAVAHAEAQHASHLCLLPGLFARSFAARSTLCLFLVGAVPFLRRVNADKPGAHFGVGAFNLIRADVYRAFGGHKPLRMEVLDDLRLGLLVRRAGGTTRVRWGVAEAQVEWGATLASLVAVLEKNYFAILRYNALASFAAAGALASVWTLGLAGPALHMTLDLTGALAATVGVVMFAAPGALAARRLNWPIASGLFCPLFAPVATWAWLNSTIKTLVQRGVRWRGTFYPLRDLRQGMARSTTSKAAEGARARGGG